MKISTFHSINIYHGIYRNDGFVVFKGLWTAKEINTWLKSFQWRVNTICNNTELNFTCDLWDPKSLQKTDELLDITINSEEHFPYLDLEMFWNLNDNLQFLVHQRKNQQLKYLNASSNHTRVGTEAIPSCVFNRLANLTSNTRKTKTKL